MKTKSIATIAIFSAFSAFALIIPQTSERTQIAHPLGDSEAAYLKNDDGTVSMLIGDKSFVSHPYTIHGYAVRQLERTEYSIVKPPQVNYNPTNDAWDVTAYPASNSIVITAASSVKITSVSFNRRIGYPSVQNPTRAGSISYSFSNNVAVITLVNTGAGGVAYPGVGVSDIAVYCERFGTKEYVNDLRLTRYEFKDEYGRWSLGGYTNVNRFGSAYYTPGLRHWVKHLYDGNRGEDWASYAASNAVHLCDNRLTFDKRNRYSYEVRNATNLVFTAAGHDIFKVYASGNGQGYENAFHINSFVRGNDFVELSYEHDIDNFNPALVGIQQSSALGGAWSNVPSGNILFESGGIIRIINQTSPNQFYRFTYDGTAITDIYTFTFTAPVTFTEPVTFTAPVTNSAPVTFTEPVTFTAPVTNSAPVTLTEPVTFESELRLRGTDNKLYRITVNEGTISATEVN